MVTAALKMATAVGGILTATAAFAAPPPPVKPPAELEQPVDGYDMQPVYGQWRYWVERQKGSVTEDLLREPDTIEGLKQLGLLLRFRKYNDFGHYLTGEIRTYCETTSPQDYEPLPGTCRYVLRRAYIPLPAEDYTGSNPLSEWTRANFDASALARHFRRIGLDPGTDWRTVDRERMFAAAPSPREVMAENAVIIRLDSMECPQMGQAIEALEGETLEVTVDFDSVGTDDERRPPRPHAVISDYTIYLRAGGGVFTMEGSRGPVVQLADPILDAADACEHAREQG